MASAENSSRDSVSMPTAEEVAKLMAESRQLDPNGYRSLILRSLRNDTPEQRVEAAAAIGNMHRMAHKVKAQSDAPSVADLGLLLEEPLRQCGATSAYLGGLYVRTDRHGDARRSDEIILFAVAESLPARHVDRYEQFRLAMKAAEGISVYPVLRAYTQKEIDNAGGLETALALTFDDWDKIL